MIWMSLLLLVPFAGLLLTVAVPVRLAPRVAIAVTGLNALIVAGRVAGLYGKHPPGRILQMDGLGLVITCITVFVGFTAALYSTHYIRTAAEYHPADRGRTKRYFQLFLAFYFTLVGVPLFQNVILTWAFIEATALTSVMLVDFHRTKLTGEAAWKYLVIMEFGGLCALFGTLLLLFGQPGHVSTATWMGIAHIAPSMSSRALLFAFVFALVGYGAKAGLTPFHFWLPDAHSQAPSPTSAMLSAIKLNCSMYGILRFLSLEDAGHERAFAHAALLVLGILTVAVCATMTVAQRDYKRLFAYSSSENMGMVAIGFALGPLGALGGFLQMINHSLIKSMLFYQSGELLHASGSTEMRGLRGVARAWPWTGGTLMLAMLAIAGAPPFGLFISELIIVYALFHTASAWLGGLVLLLLITLFANFMRYAIQIGYGENSEQLRRFREAHRRPWEAALPFGIHITLVLALGILLPFGLSAVRGITL